MVEQKARGRKKNISDLIKIFDLKLILSHESMHPPASRGVQQPKITQK